MTERTVHRASRKMAAAVAGGLILLPALAFLGGHRGQPIENRASRPFEGVTGWDSFMNFGGFVSDRIPLRARAVRVDGWIDEHVFKEDPAFGGGATPRVIRGQDGFLFLADAIDVACAPNAPPDETAANFARLATIIAASGRGVLSMVAPDKSTSHPELLPADLAEKGCFTAYTDTLWRDLDNAHIPGFVNLRDALSHAIATSREPLYLRKDSHWDSAGSLVAVRAAIDHFAPGLWNQQEVAYKGLTDYTGDLTGMQGNPQVDQAPLYTIVRPDVTPLVNEPIDTTSNEINRHFVNSAPPGRLIPGKTVMFLDSYGLVALPQIGPFFEDLTVVRLIDFDPARFKSLIADAGRVWIMTVERSAGYRLTYEVGSSDFLDDLESSLPKHEDH